MSVLLEFVLHFLAIIFSLFVSAGVSLKILRRHLSSLKIAREFPHVVVTTELILKVATD